MPVREKQGNSEEAGRYPGRDLRNFFEQIDKCSRVIYNLFVGKTIDNFNWPNRGRHYAYPWDQWLNGEIWEIKRGEDFAITAENMRMVLYAAGQRERKKVRTTLPGEGTLVFQAFKEEEPQRAI